MLGNKNRKDIVKHILPTASNLLALCFILLSFIRLSKQLLNISEKSIVDGCLAIIITIFFFSSILSYASMRSKKRSEIYEKIADVAFIMGLICLTLVAVGVVFQTI
jgi:uncharacterized membrane protein